MGVTYKAEDTNLHKPVALKVINSLFLNNQTARDRFIREARAAASLSHRNVATVYLEALLRCPLLLRPSRWRIISIYHTVRGGGCLAAIRAHSNTASAPV